MCAFSSRSSVEIQKPTKITTTTKKSLPVTVRDTLALKAGLSWQTQGDGTSEADRGVDLALSHQILALLYVLLG